MLKSDRSIGSRQGRRASLHARRGHFRITRGWVRFAGAVLLVLCLSAVSVFISNVGYHRTAAVNQSRSNQDQGAPTPPATVSQPTHHAGGQTGKVSKRSPSTKAVSSAGPQRAGSPKYSSSSFTAGGSGSSGNGFVSAAFDLGWQPVGSLAPFSKLNEDFLFALQTENGSGLDAQLLSGVPSVSAWVARVHVAPHATDRAILTIGGSSDQNWQYACNSANRSAFVSNLVNFMKSHNFDGLDIDMEDNAITAAWPVPSLWTGCAQAIINAAHAVTSNGHRPIVSEDVITNWEGPWLQPYESGLDQINLMTYGDTCTSASNCPVFASDVADTVSQLCPHGGSCVASVKSRFVLGLDMDDNPGTMSSCGYAAAYARVHRYKGAFDWDLTSDQHRGATYPCQSAISANG